MRLFLYFVTLILLNAAIAQDIHVGINLTSRFYTQQSNSYSTLDYLVISDNSQFSEHAMPVGIFSLFDFDGRIVRLGLQYQYLNSTNFYLYPATGNQSPGFDQEYLNFLHEKVSFTVQYLMPIDKQNIWGLYTGLNVERYFMHNQDDSRIRMSNRIGEELARQLSLDVFDSFRSFMLGYETGLYFRPSDRFLFQLYFFDDLTSFTRRLENGDFLTRFSGIGIGVSYSIFKL